MHNDPASACPTIPTSQCPISANQVSGEGIINGSFSNHVVTDSRKQSLSETSAAKVFELLDSLGRNVSPPEVDAVLATQLEKAGMLREMPRADYTSKSLILIGLPETSRLFEKKMMALEADQDEMASLSRKINSGLYHAWCKITFNAEQIEEDKLALLRANDRSKVLINELSTLRPELKRLQDIQTELKQFVDTPAGCYALTDEGARYVKAFATRPKSYGDLTYDGSQKACKEWKDLLATWKKADAAPHLDQWSAAQITFLVTGIGKDLDKILTLYKKAYALNGVNHSAAGAIACDATMTKRPLDVYADAVSKAYEVPHLDSFAASHLAIASVREKKSIKSYTDAWEKAYALRGCNSMSAALLAETSVTHRIPLESVLTAWSEVYALNGCGEMAAAELADYAVRTGSDLKKFIEDWKIAYVETGINDLTAASLAISSDLTKTDIKELISEWKKAYVIEGIDAGAAAQMVRHARLENTVLDRLIESFGAAKAEGIPSGAATQLACGNMANTGSFLMRYADSPKTSSILS